MHTYVFLLQPSPLLGLQQERARQEEHLRLSGQRQRTRRNRDLRNWWAPHDGIPAAGKVAQGRQGAEASCGRQGAPLFALMIELSLIERPLLTLVDHCPCDWK